MSPCPLSKHAKTLVYPSTILVFPLKVWAFLDCLYNPKLPFAQTAIFDSSAPGHVIKWPGGDMLTDTQFSLICCSSSVSAVLLVLVSKVTAVLLALPLPASIYKDPEPGRCRLLITKEVRSSATKLTSHQPTSHCSLMVMGYWDGGENDPMAHVRDTKQLAAWTASADRSRLELQLCPWAMKLYGTSLHPSRLPWSITKMPVWNLLWRLDSVGKRIQIQSLCLKQQYYKMSANIKIPLYFIFRYYSVLLLFALLNHFKNFRLLFDFFVECLPEYMLCNTSMFDVYGIQTWVCISCNWAYKWLSTTMPVPETQPGSSWVSSKCFRTVGLSLQAP